MWHYAVLLSLAASAVSKGPPAYGPAKYLSAFDPLTVTLTGCLRQNPSPATSMCAECLRAFVNCTQGQGYALFIIMLCVLQESVSSLLRQWEPLILQWPVLGSAARQDLLARLASSELIFFMALKDSSTFEKVWRDPWGVPPLLEAQKGCW